MDACTRPRWELVHIGTGMTRNKSKVPTSKSVLGSGVVHVTVIAGLDLTLESGAWA